MKFIEDKIISSITKGWSWCIPKTTQILAVNSMANIFLKDENDKYWRVCPEELSATIEANNEAELQKLFNDPEYKEDWQFSSLVNIAEEKFGKLQIGQCYKMVLPAILGGEYNLENMVIADTYEYLEYTGDLAQQTKDVKDGQQVKIKITD